MQPEVSVPAGKTNCLGWCNKEFVSPDKTRIRYCPACTAKKDQAERASSGTRRLRGVQE